MAWEWQPPPRPCFSSTGTCPAWRGRRWGRRTGPGPACPGSRSGAGGGCRGECAPRPGCCEYPGYNEIKHMVSIAASRDPTSMHTGQLLWDVSWMHLCCLSRGRQRPHVSQCWNLSLPPTLRRWHYDTLTYSPHCHGSVLGVLQECDRAVVCSAAYHQSAGLTTLHSALRCSARVTTLHFTRHNI